DRQYPQRNRRCPGTGHHPCRRFGGKYFGSRRDRAVPTSGERPVGHGGSRGRGVETPAEEPCTATVDRGWLRQDVETGGGTSRPAFAAFRGGSRVARRSGT